MKLGILGIDSRIAGVVAAAIRRGDTLVVAGDLSASAGRSFDLLAGVPRDSWETLLDPRVCDAVLVGSDDWNESRGDAVRALVQAGRMLLLSHPLTLSMLWAYELEMIRGDTGSRLIPYLPDRLHPFIGRLRERIEAGLGGADPLGPVEQISLERRLTDRSREAVLAALAVDVDLVRVLAGEPSRLSTLGSGELENAWPTLAVGFSGQSNLPVRWQVVRGDPAGGLTVTLAHARGLLSVEIPDDVVVASTDVPRMATPPWSWCGDRTDMIDFDRAETMLDLLHGRQTAASGIAAAGWDDAARAVELAETVPRSLTKGRAVDLHHEEFSELGTFRGVMASLGCGLVLAALGLLVLATLVGGIAHQAGWDWAERIAGAWPVVVLTVLGLFLTLQVLPVLVGRTPGETPEAHPSGEGATPAPGRRPGHE